MLLELCTFVLYLWETGVGKHLTRHACHLRLLGWNVFLGGLCLQSDLFRVRQLLYKQSALPTLCAHTYAQRTAVAEGHAQPEAAGHQRQQQHQPHQHHGAHAAGDSGAAEPGPQPAHGEGAGCRCSCRNGKKRREGRVRQRGALGLVVLQNLDHEPAHGEGAGCGRVCSELACCQRWSRKAGRCRRA